MASRVLVSLLLVLFALSALSLGEDKTVKCTTYPSKQTRFFRDIVYCDNGCLFEVSTGQGNSDGVKGFWQPILQLGVTSDKADKAEAFDKELMYFGMIPKLYTHQTSNKFWKCGYMLKQQCNLQCAAVFFAANPTFLRTLKDELPDAAKESIMGHLDAALKGLTVQPFQGDEAINSAEKLNAHVKQLKNMKEGGKVIDKCQIDQIPVKNRKDCVVVPAADAEKKRDLDVKNALAYLAAAAAGGAAGSADAAAAGSSSGPGGVASDASTGKGALAPAAQVKIAKSQ